MTSTAIPATTTSTAPVAPGGLPLLGHALALRRDPIGFLGSLREHGEVVKIHLGPLGVHVVTSPRTVHQVLVTESGSFDKGRLFDKMRGFLGNGLLTSNGAFNRRQRRLIQPAFHRDMIAVYAQVMREKTEEMTASWQSGQVVDVQHAIDQLTLGIGIGTLFASDLGKRSFDEVIECLPVVLNGVLLRTVLPDFVFKLPLPGIQRFNRAQSQLRRVVGRIISSYRADGGDHHDLLTMLLNARDDDTGQGMTDKQVRDEVVTLMLAAAETTSGVLGTLFHSLAEHPDIDRRVHAELGERLGGRPIEYEDVTRFDYTMHVLTETLRVGVPVDMLMRRTNKEVTIGETRLPAGAEVIFSVPALHRDPESYPDPLAFDPERWVRKPARELPKGAFIPFIEGNRQCIGNAFALTELTVVAATVLSRWKLTVAPGARPRKIHSATTHFTDLLMTVERRGQAESR